MVVDMLLYIYWERATISDSILENRVNQSEVPRMELQTSCPLTV
jgi:hypothetical protein